MTVMEQQNILRYDPELIAQQYRKAPLTVIRRLLTIVWLIGGFFLRLKLDQWRGLEQANKEKRAIQLRTILTKLGPTFIKVGQALSTRPDLVRKDFLDELTKLQDQLPPFDNAIAFQIIETELQRPLKEIYREISPNPIAAASLGQVYRAVLYSGEEVAVKVQRPNLKARLTLDLFIMRWGVNQIKQWLPVNLGHDLTLVIDEFGTKLFEEINYLNEGANADKFAFNFQDDPTVKIPKVYPEYSSYRVITLEWINGFKLTDREKLEAANLDQNRLIEIGVVSGLRQLLEYGFFHADPHPGNLFAMPDGRIAYIDFGMMDQLKEETKETIASSIVHLINRDYERLAQDFIDLGFLTPDTPLEPIISPLEAVLGDAMGESVKDFNFKTITDQFSELVYDYPFRIPVQFALIIRSVVTQEGLALTLDPNFKIVEVAYPYVAQRLLRGESPEMRRRLIEVLFKDGKFQWERLENLIAIAQTNNQNFDLLPTAQLGIQYLLSEEGNDLRNQLLLALTEDEQLHTEQVQRIWNLVKEDLKPTKLFDFALTSLREMTFEEVATLVPTTNNQQN